MWQDYLRERLGKIVLQEQNGFAVIQMVDESTMYLEDIFVVKDFRSKGEAQKISEKVYEAAKKLKCKTLLGSVNIKAKGAEYSTRIIIENGFKFSHLDQHNEMIYFKKDVV